MHRVVVAAVAGIVALMFAAVGGSASPRALTATCADGGGVVWKLRSSWGAPYTSQGVRRVRTYGTEFTTSAPITRVHYTIRTYNGTGRLVQTLQGRRSFDFDYKGIAWLRRNTLNPRSRPGKVRITVTVGSAGVAGCLVASRQPPAHALGLPASLLRQRRVELALDAVLDVPRRLAVANEQQPRRRRFWSER